MLDWCKFEGFIRSQASRLIRNRSDYEDFVQVGRIAAWKLCSSREDVNEAYVRSRIRSRMIDYMRNIYETEKNSAYMTVYPEDLFDRI